MSEGLFRDACIRVGVTRNFRLHRHLSATTLKRRTGYNRYPCTILLVSAAPAYCKHIRLPTPGLSEAGFFGRAVVVVKTSRLCDELDNTAGLLDLALGVLGEVAGADDEGNLRDATLAEDLAVAEGEEVEDGGGLGGLVGQVLLALLSGDEGPELKGLLVFGSVLLVAYCAIEVSPRTLSRLMTGFQKWAWTLWKYLIPTLPK